MTPSKLASILMAMRNRIRWFLSAAALGVTACAPTPELPETEARAWTPPETVELPWGQWFGASATAGSARRSSRRCGTYCAETS